jgi:squalene cyclase
MEKSILKERYQTLCSQLLVEQNSDGFWSGRLSSSALSTAVSIVALKTCPGNKHEDLIDKGLKWLYDNINTDGGYGDTPESESNVSTSLLCYAAIYYSQDHKNERGKALRSVESFLETKNISLTTDEVTASIMKFYGTDYTFSVPILSMLTLCGVLADEAYERVPVLPFEFSLLPFTWYRFFRLQVVSYAIPALIGVGIFIHSKRKTRFSFLRFYRNLCISAAIKKLTAIMPESGGFLEAIPLTGFVSMCLAASGYGANRVVKNGVLFLCKQQRRDGSWPIDTDLSTWVTTLSIKALGSDLKDVLPPDNIQRLKKHLLSIQYRTKHPFNGADPGGWGWTNQSGSVPDADDTSGSILALLNMYEGTREEIEAIILGCNWLVGLQNSDGGFPTFCKGWGRLPFDSSCADLTGHALLALLSPGRLPGGAIPDALRRNYYRSAVKAAGYLQKHQTKDGNWFPLWFGNQLTDDRKNPVYGTTKVCVYLQDCLDNNLVSGKIREDLSYMIDAAMNYLLLQQNHDGSWGGKKGIRGTVEETALAICALGKYHPKACVNGFNWLSYQSGTSSLSPSPIGLYFAALWYDEKMYPLVYYIEALRRFIHDSNHIKLS